MATSADVAAPTGTAAQPECPPDGSVQFLCGDAAAEDLAAVPGTPWLLASSYSGPGGIRLIDTRTRSVRPLFPVPGAAPTLGSEPQEGCPGPPSATDLARFITQGLSLQPAEAGTYRLYAVHHGQRESIEFFRLDPQIPALTWIGCAIAPDAVRLNSVVGLADGGFIATKFRDQGPGEAQSMQRLRAGEDNGELWEWHPRKGWSIVPGSQGSGLNGVEVSADGRWLYVDAWGSRTFFRLSRGIDPPRRETIAVGFRIDNVRWSSDHRLIATGQTDHGTRIIEIDPNRLQLEPLLEIADTAEFGAGSVALPVDGRLWVGSFRSPRIAIFPDPRAPRH